MNYTCRSSSFLIAAFVLLSTACAFAGTVKFAVFGDYGDDNSQVDVVSALVMFLNPDIILTTGDNNYGPADYENNVAQFYGTFIGGYSGIYPAGPAVANNKFFPSLGNHDWDDAGLAAYQAFFTLPGISASSSGNERYYDFVVGPVHFFCIDSDPHEPDGRTATSVQAQWLQAQLSTSPYCWKIVFMHHPPFSSGSDNSHNSQTILQWPYEAWGASAVLTGHAHFYERIHRDDNQDGIMCPYFVCGTGGRSFDSFSATLAGGSQFRYNSNVGTMMVLANDSSMKFQFWSVAGGGTVIDSITIYKQPGADGLCSNRVNCDDGNPCTLDGFNGQCTHTPLVCNDNNTCTRDSCVSGQCNYIPIPNCTNCQLQVTRLMLVNAATDNDLRALNNNDTLYLSVNPSVNIRADVCQPVGSVKFMLNGSQFRIESGAPYCLAGDNSGNYNKWNVSTGLYAISAIPYSGSNAGGTSGTARTINLRVLSQPSQNTGCTGNAACNDNNSCTTDICQNGQCTHTPVSCNDNNSCTTDLCQNGQCVYTPMNCNDNNSCTVDACSGGVCTHTQQSGSEPSYLKVVNSARSNRKLKLGYSPNSLWSPRYNVIAGGNNMLCITLRNPAGNAQWNKIQVKPQGSSSATLSNYISGPIPNWTTICIPLSTFSGVNFTQISMLEIPVSNYAEAFEIHLQRIVFTGGSSPFLWFGDPKTNNYHDGQSGSSSALVASLVAGSPCGAPKTSADGEVKEQKIQATETELLTAFPNPFTEKVYIRFMRPVTEKVRVEIVNTEGKLIEILLDETVLENQSYQVEFPFQTPVTEGIYFCRLITESGKVYYRKLMML